MAIKIAFGPLPISWSKREFITPLHMIFVGREFDESHSEEIAYHHHFASYSLPRNPHFDIS